MKSITLAGYFGYGNIGDEAILAGMVTQLEHDVPGHSISVLSASPQQTTAEHGVPAIDLSDLEAVNSAISSSQMLILGGGGIFHDKWGVPTDSFLTPNHSGLPYLAGLASLAHLSRTPVMTYAVGIGPLLTKDGSRLTEAILSQCGLVTVRDNRSANLAAELVRSQHHRHVRLVADPAFALDLPDPQPPKTARSGGGGKVIGVSVRHWQGRGVPDGWETELASALDALVQHFGFRVQFLPMQANPNHAHENDLRVAHAVRAAMEEVQAVDPIEPMDGLASLVDRMGSLDCVLAMRYHALLFALRLGIPAVAMAYDEKVASLAIEAGSDGACLEPTSWRSSEIRQALQRAIEGVDSPPPDLSDLMQRASETGGLVAEALQDGYRARELHPLLAEMLGRGLVRSSLLFDSKAQMEHLRAQRDSLMVQRNRLQLELGALRETIGVRWLQSYWDAMRRLLPEASRRRQLYFLIRQRIRQLWLKLRGRALFGPGSGLRTTPSYSRDGAQISGAQAGAHTTDPRLALARFSDRLGFGASGSVAVILSTTQLIESEGQRPTRLALGLARRGVPVVFGYWRWDESEWVRNERLDQGIVQVPIDLIVRHPEDLLELLPTGEHVLYLAFPYPPCFDLVGRANAAGWIVQYDLMDDWSAFADVGQAPWYEASAESLLVQSADLVTAVSATLVTAVRSAGRDAVDLVPNAAERSLLTLPRGSNRKADEVILGYYGHLSRAWFDWDLVLELAKRRPSWAIDLIGYGGESPRGRPPANIRFRGKRPHSELPALASDWSVGLVPFKDGPVALASDPIKVYEYLALGLPVVGSGFLAPAGSQRYVTVVDSADGYLEAIERVLADDGQAQRERISFARRATWDDRIDELLSLWGGGAQRIAEKRWLFGR